jgi:hypothetical protein
MRFNSYRVVSRNGLGTMPHASQTLDKHQPFYHCYSHIAALLSHVKICINFEVLLGSGNGVKLAKIFLVLNVNDYFFFHGAGD